VWAEIRRSPLGPHGIKRDRIVEQVPGNVIHVSEMPRRSSYSRRQPESDGETVTKPLARFEGRLFAEGGCLFLVVYANEATGTARVTCRLDGQLQVIEMPLAEVAKRVSSSTGLILDNLHGPETEKRIVEQDGGWYFHAREGRIGPFMTRKEAGGKLARYILSMQLVNAAPREPARPARSERRQSAFA
jgi:hypothetical protein